MTKLAPSVNVYEWLGRYYFQVVGPLGSLLHDNKTAYDDKETARRYGEAWIREQRT